MKEIRDIIRSYQELKTLGKRCALATVVHVEGSSYRRPGARMLISEEGRLTGAISGGCLEGDAKRKALLVINEQVPSLVTYDTMDEDDATIGIGLGCNGIIHILIEPIQHEDPNNPMVILQNITEDRQNSVIFTFFSFKNKKQKNTGTKYFVNQSAHNLEDTILDIDRHLLLKEAKNVLIEAKNVWLNFPTAEEEITVFLQFVPPAVSLIIVGAGNDVLPLVDMADVLGWDTTVIDGRANYAKKERFEKACDVFIAKPEQVIESVVIDDFTFFALMTHNYNYDKALLHELCQNKVRYIAMLGPKNKLQRILDEYEEENRPLSQTQIASIYSPAGLDIGAETSEEIALSILSEIKAVMSYKQGNPLRNKEEGIHV